MSIDYLHEIIKAMSFPDDVANVAVSAVSSGKNKLKQLVSEGGLRIDEAVDLKEILCSEQKLEREIGRRVIVDKELKEKTEYQNSAVAGEKRQKEIEGFIKRRNEFIQNMTGQKDQFEEQIKAFQEQKKELKMLVREKKNKATKAQREKEKALAAKQEEDMKEMKEKKVEEIKKRFEETHSKNQKAIEEWEQKYKDAKPSQEYYYQKQEKKAKRKKKLEEKKVQLILKEIKHNAEPIDPKTIIDHQTNYLQTLKAKEEERLKQHKLNNEKERKDKQYIHRFHSSMDDNAEDDLKLFKSKDFKMKEERKKKVEKMLKAAEEMQEQHKPKISEKKKQQLEEQIMKLENRDKREAKSEIADRSEEDPESKRYPWRKFMSKNPIKDKPLSVLPDIHKPNTYRDYLTEERASNPLPKLDEKIVIAHLLERKGLPFSEKVELVKEKVREMEEKAHRKMQLIKIDAKGGSQELFKEASDIYINSIKAKLSLLDKAK